MLEAFGNALPYFGMADYWVAFMIGLLLAILTSVVPGVSALVLMALAVPFIVVNIRDPVIGLTLLAVITGINNTLDSLPAIVFGMPSASTQVTFLEGHQMARRGEAARALGAVYTVSAIGGITGAVLLAIAIPVIRPIILSIGYGEVAAISLFGLALIAVLSQGAVQKGVIAAMVGLLLGTIGIAPLGGARRFVFGELTLWQGLPLVTVALGLFTLPEMVDLLMTRKPVAARGAKISVRESFAGGWEGLKRWKIAVRQGIFGTAMGALPGIGGAVIDWLAYAFGILWAKDRSQFGKGSLDGLLFAESAQNSKEAGAAIPTLAFGVPGTGVWAIVLTALLVYGVTPGPQMVNQFAHLTIVLVLTLALGNVFLTMLGLVSSSLLARLTLIPYPAVAAVVIPLAIISGFLAALSWLALPIIFSLGALGFLMKRYGWPRPPLFIGFILGPIIEKNLQDAINVHGPLGLAMRPATIGLTLAAIVLAVTFHWLMARAAKRVPIQTVQADEASTIVPSGGADDSPAPQPASQAAPAARRLTFQWRLEHSVPIVLFLIASYFTWEALGLPPRGRTYPLTISILIMTLTFVQFWRLALQPKKEGAGIMDIGVLSLGMVGARQAGFIIIGLFLLFCLFSATFGMNHAAVLFAVMTPLPFIAGRMKWVVAGVGGLIVAAFTYGVVEYFMDPIWPRPVWGIF